MNNLPTNALVVAKNLSIRPKQSIVSMKLVSNLWELSILPCFHQFSVELSSTWVCLNIQYWFPPVIWQSRGFTAFPMSDTLEHMKPLAHREIHGFYTVDEEPRAKSGFNIQQITLSLWSRHFLVALLKISPLPSNLCCGISTAMLSRYLSRKYTCTNIEQDKGSHQKLEQGSKQRQPTIGMICTEASPWELSSRKRPQNVRLSPRAPCPSGHNGRSTRILNADLVLWRC